MGLFIDLSIRMCRGQIQRMNIIIKKRESNLLEKGGGINPSVVCARPGPPGGRIIIK